MELTHEIHRPARKNSASNPIWMDLLRIVLGTFLLIKGFIFLGKTSEAFYLLAEYQDIIGTRSASLFTSAVHIIGGLMIAFGALTRLAILCQIPVLLGAVFIINSPQGLHVGNLELWISVLVLSLLLFFMVVGPGRYSVDHKILRPVEPQKPKH